jgi:uracil-DNA glycosylase family protein
MTENKPKKKAAMKGVVIHPRKARSGSNLDNLRAAAKKCKACPLWKKGTQTVFGEGPCDSRIIFIGEQPGDKEDIAGRPFIGPAGNLLDRALAEVGIDRSAIYVTNAVKHFKWEQGGKRRIHKKPNSREIAACRPWLEAELNIIRPEYIVCLGVTAAQTILGRGVKIGEERGRLTSSPPYAASILITVHPSSLLRIPDESARRAAWSAFLKDLKCLKP